MIRQRRTKALVMQGELTIRTQRLERTYRVGDVFHLQCGEPHSEVFGAQGVHYLGGRKQA